MISFSKPNETSPHPPTPQMPPSRTMTIVENVDQLIQPIAAITEIVQANTPKHHPSYIEESSKCITDQAVKRESSPCVSPAKKRQKINVENFPEINQNELTNILLESIGNFI